MTNSKLYIGLNELDFNSDVEIKTQVYDLLDSTIGALNRSITFDIPLTEKNLRYLGHINLVNAIIPDYETARIVDNGINIIEGKLKIINPGIGDTKARAYIDSLDWGGALEDVYIDEIWEETDSHEFNNSAVQSSWVAVAGYLYRYPLINWGDMFVAGKYSLIDFVPMWNVRIIIERIFANANVNLDYNGFLVNKSMYVLAPWKLYNENDSLISSMEALLQINSTTQETDNGTSSTHTTGTPESIIINPIPVNFTDVITDTAGAYNTTSDQYNITVSATYRFTFKIYVYSSHDIDADYTVLSREFNAQIRYTNGTEYVDLDTYSATAGITFDGTLLVTLDTGYRYLQAGGYITCNALAYSEAYNDGATRTIKIYLTSDTALQLMINDAGDYPSTGYIQNPRDYLPHITGTQFLRSLKHIFGLIFQYDRPNNTLYIQNFNSFIGSNIIDWTDKVIQITDNEIAASKSKQRIILKYKKDENDWFYNEKYIDDVSPYQKEILIDSDFAIPGTDFIPNELFSSTVKNIFPCTNNLNVLVPTIYTGDNNGTTYGYKAPLERGKKFNPRILAWLGDAAPTAPETIDWDYYDDVIAPSYTNKTTYPQAVTPDLNIYYLTYNKRYNSIENGKLISAVVNLEPFEFYKFLSVLNDAENEGLRSYYKIKFDGQTQLFYVSDIVYSKGRAKLTLISK